MHGISLSITITSAPSPTSSSTASFDSTSTDLVNLNASLLKTYQALQKDINGSSETEAQCNAAVNIMGLPDQTQVTTTVVTCGDKQKLEDLSRPMSAPMWEEFSSQEKRPNMAQRMTSHVQRTD